MTRVLSEPTILVPGIANPEGPVFDSAGNLYWVNWSKSTIMRRTPEGDVGDIYNTGGIPAGLAFDREGWLYIADEGDDNHGVLRIKADGSSPEMVVNEYQGKPLNGANDLVFAPDGVLYFSDPWRSSLESPIGGFYRYFPDGRLEQIDTGLCFPNGVAVAADGTYVYLAETLHDRILRYRIYPDGTIGPREHFATVPPPHGPDGMCFAANGELLVAHHDGSGVDVFAPTGEWLEKIDIPGRYTTNCCFGGSNNSTLIVTDVETQALYSVELSITGQPLYA
jgi:gluconolactonase